MPSEGPGDGRSERLARQHQRQHGGTDQQQTAETEDRAVADTVGQHTAEQRAEREAGEDGRLQQPHSVAEAFLGRRDGDQRHRGRDGAGERSIEDEEDQELPGSDDQAHQPGGDRAADHGTYQHRLTAIAIRRHAPKRRGERHAAGAAGLHGTGPERLAAGRARAELPQIEGQERITHGEAEDRQRLGDPQHIKVAPPVAGRPACTLTLHVAQLLDQGTCAGQPHADTAGGAGPVPTTRTTFGEAGAMEESGESSGPRLRR